MHFAALGFEHARLVRIGEERDGIVGLDQHDVLKILQDRQRLLDHVRDAVDREPALAARHARIVGLAHHLAAGLARDLGGQRQPVLGERAAGHQQQRRRAAVAQHLRGMVHGLRGIIGALAFHRHRRNAVGLVPGGIGGQDQGCDLRRRAFGRSDRGGAVGGNGFRIRRGPHPGRHRPRQPFDV